ncbi:MAG TPA: sulfatase-like hydrolase/transferase [Phycisphaerae bacterium]|nr:sulfatase-like hydrolase/transferase [Phycisphaerae bacterium]
MPQRPNILYILTDQQSADAMSCAGNEDLRTPAMDSLAEAGVRFENAYCTQPLCSPSRASMFTGMMPRQAGVPRNGMAISAERRAGGVGLLLRQAGYECAYGGKWHVPEISIPEGHGFEQICPFGDDVLAEACAKFLGRKHDRPFFLVASFDNPHNICEYARNMPLPWGAIGDAPPPQDCPNLPANFAIPPYEPEAIRVEQRADHNIYPTVAFTEDDWRRYRWGYCRLIEKVDAEIARVLDALRAGGLEDRTLVIFSSDHGDGHAEHQWSQKSVLYEAEVRVPLTVSFKGVSLAGGVDRTHLVSNGLDLLPTLCDYAGAQPPAGVQGRSLRPLIEGGHTPSWRDGLVVETVFDGTRGYRTQGRMVRTDRYKYVAYDWGRCREQLFDLQADPGEMVNLAVEAGRRELLADLRNRLAGWCRTTDDNFCPRRKY